MPERIHEKAGAAGLIDTIRTILIFGVISSLVSTVLTTISFWFIDQKEQGGTTTLGMAAQRALPRTPIFFVASALVGIIAMLGFFLFVIPGVIWGLMFSQATLFVLLKNQTIGQSLSSSRQLTNGHRWLIFRAWGQIILFGFLLGLLFLGTGFAFSKMLNPEAGLILNTILSSAGSIFLWNPFGILLPYAVWRALHAAQPAKA